MDAITSYRDFLPQKGLQFQHSSVHKDKSFSEDSFISAEGARMKDDVGLESLGSFLKLLYIAEVGRSPGVFNGGRVQKRDRFEVDDSIFLEVFRLSFLKGNVHNTCRLINDNTSVYTVIKTRRISECIIDNNLN